MQRAEQISYSRLAGEKLWPGILDNPLRCLKMFMLRERGEFLTGKECIHLAHRSVSDYSLSSYRNNQTHLIYLQVDDSGHQWMKEAFDLYICTVHLHETYATLIALVAEPD